MNESLKRTSLGGALFLIAVLVLTGCGAPAQAQQSIAVARLEASKLVVEHIVPDGTTRELMVHEPVDTHEGDEINVDTEGRATLRIPGAGEVELYRGATVTTERIRVDPDGHTFTILRLVGDHARFWVPENMDSTLMVVTDYATATLTMPGSEAMMCHGEALTCIAAMRGEVEVEAQRKVRTLVGGQSTYVLKGNPPEPIICSDQTEFRQWLDQKLSAASEEDRALGALVREWPQGPCPEKATSTASAPDDAASSMTVTSPDGALACTVIARTLNLRDAPSTSHGHRIGLLRYGDHFQAAARNADGTWVEGHAQGSDQTGWVYARYVSCDGSVADLPVSE